MQTTTCSIRWWSMATKNTKAFLVNASVRHAIYINRFGGSQIKEMLPYLARIRRNIAAELDTTSIANMSRRRLKRLYNEITGLNAAALEAMGKKLKGNMREFAAYERDFSARMLSRGTKVDWDVPSQNQVVVAILTQPVLEIANKGLPIDDLLEEFSDKKAQQLVQVIQEGVVTGKSNAAILEDMSFVTDVSMANGLKALVRTVTTHTSDVARQELYRENEDVIEGVQWVATLDSDTCLTCGGLDGQLFEQGRVPDQPHFNCRCVTVPIVKREFSIQGVVEGLDRPARGPGNEPQHGIAASTTYNDWLRDQPAWFQDDVLGVTRGQLFREGGLRIERFTDDNRNTLTINQLKNSDERAIKSAITKSGILDDE